MGLKRKNVLKPQKDIDNRRAKDLEPKTVLVEGEEQEIFVPPSSRVPKEIKWDVQKLKVAELIADGMSLLTISKMPNMPSRPIIHGWMKHPEFKSYVESLVIETGLANKVERIAAMKRVTNMLYEKFEEQLFSVPMTDKNAASLIKTFFDGLKQVNEDLRGYDQLIKVDAEQKIEANVATLDIDALLQNSPEEQRALLQSEFQKRADAIIRGLE